MKLKVSEKIHYESGPNMTPLVDIIMVILIFMMLTGTFAVGEWYLQSNMPMTEKGTGGTSVSNVPLDEPLEIRVETIPRIDPQSGLTVEVWVASAGRIQVENDRAALTSQLDAMRQKLNAANTPTSRIQVVISPGRSTRYKHLVEVYQAALEAKLEKVAFSRSR
jgi:biopolymer transport protein ExbD